MDTVLLWLVRGDELARGVLLLEIVEEADALGLLDRLALEEARAVVLALPDTEGLGVPVADKVTDAEKDAERDEEADAVGDSEDATEREPLPEEEGVKLHKRLMVALAD